MLRSERVMIIAYDYDTAQAEMRRIRYKRAAAVGFESASS
jgi:hypothetical protein